MVRVRAVNTAADSENKIHDDAVALAYGFRGGLVPGVTVYGYMAAGAMDYFGEEWLERGAMNVRFEQPVYDGEEIEVAVSGEADGRARVEIPGRASGIAWMGDHPAPPELGEGPLVRQPAWAGSLCAGTIMGTLREKLKLSESKMSAPLDASIGGKAHPAILLALVNRMFVENYELGPWIHVASEVRKFRSARDGEEICVRAGVVEQYERKGHDFVVFDAVISGESLIEAVRHTAIWRPRSAARKSGAEG